MSLYGCVFVDVFLFMDFGANNNNKSTIFWGGRHARNIAHSVRILALRLFLQDGFRDLSGEPLGPHFGIIWEPQSLHYTTFWVIF